MSTGNIPQTLLNTFQNDFKAEVIAAELVENGTDAERLLILMLGALKRPFSNDVESIEEELSPYDHKEYLVMKSPKEGIYDQLPEGLFHHTLAHKSAKTEKEIIQIMKLRREEERNARKFFLPFEATINFMRMQMALYENRLDKRSHYDDLVNIFSGQWEIFQYLNARQANIFLHLIPIIHDIRDDHAVIETIMEMMFLIPVHITLRSQVPLRPEDPALSELGKNTLGVDLTTGNALYDEGTDEILVYIGPMQNDAFTTFMPGGINVRILQLLSDYLLPVHCDIIFEYGLNEGNKIIRLADESGDNNSMLGEDTYL